jgi:hypothetical protein
MDLSLLAGEGVKFKSIKIPLDKYYTTIYGCSRKYMDASK